MLPDLKRVHCIGIGGIHVGAVAKLLRSRGVLISGTDTVEHELTQDLRKHGVDVKIGHDASHLPSETDTVIYSHAVPEDNPELVAAEEKGIPCFDTHTFLGQLFEGKDQIVVTGTHGKSTTTSLLGVALEAIGADPTVVLGTKIASFPDGNLRVGSPDLLVVEGDEYKRHVLSYEPKILILNNIEYDHPDAFKDLDAYRAMFSELIELVRDGGIIVYNADDAECVKLIESKIDFLKEREVSILSVGKDQGVIRFANPAVIDGMWRSSLRAMSSDYLDFDLQIPGEMNIRNAAMAITGTVAFNDEADLEKIKGAFATFPGCWRRFERVGVFNGAQIISDYGHHPTEVKATLDAAKKTYPDQRIVLCYQPHHRNRTKGLFHEFLTSFDQADVVLMSEIYDVPGREAKEDAAVSSQQIVDAIKEEDSNRQIEFVGALDSTEQRLREAIQPNDIVILMGAGTVDQLARKLVMNG
ncbi:UDP-N-acetylmuramate--L-alanine ligase [Candidatus Uhrbacteria bacterium]|nr:UDP-N-acetylmuramate--L-alanine ligase [Candidatus Uhrbacteria bacterium]MBD3284141.1 UDP-N-acetylmuramate--L-alanine ligase [Candidatus Uhrbacteria bacterium]